MSLAEQRALTLAMRDSGRILNWPGLNGPLLDKHSTGGVGDMVSLVLGPLVAACGAYVPMISGRGLGHTGGTLDKLESIPGFTTSLDIGRFKQLVARNHIAIVGQSDELVPADRRIYAVRDVTATVASVPLIVASILSKKLAEGLNGLVMDIKLGSGAFMREPDEARRLAHELCRVAGEAWLPCTALITDMNQPLASSAGNSLEIRESVDFLSAGTANDRLYEVVMALGAEMLVLGGLAENQQAAAERLQTALASGDAAEVFARMVASQGGPADLLQRPDEYLPHAPVVRPVFPDSRGFVDDMDIRAIGFTVVHLGGGRRRAEDDIDPSVGLSGICELGQAVDEGTALAVIHAPNEQEWEHAAIMLQSAIGIDDYAVDVGPVVHERIAGDLK
jgi:thymidine phosphorylase